MLSYELLLSLQISIVKYSKNFTLRAALNDCVLLHFLQLDHIMLLNNIFGNTMSVSLFLSISNLFLHLKV